VNRNIWRNRATPAAPIRSTFAAVVDELRQFGKHPRLEAKAVEFTSAAAPSQNLFDGVLLVE